MSTHPIPPGPRLQPYLSVRDAAAALAFYRDAFGAVEDYRIDMGGGLIGHAEMTLGDSRFMLAEEFPKLGSVGPETLGGTSVSLLLYVEDVDAVTARAAAAGATVERAPEDKPHGDRQAWIVDPFGHRWSLASRIETLSSEEIKARYGAMGDQGQEG